MRLTVSMDEMSYRLNRLPRWAQQYIHDLASRDPAGDTQTIADLREQVQALSLRVQELEKEKGLEKRRVSGVEWWPGPSGYYYCVI